MDSEKEQFPENWGNIEFSKAINLVSLNKKKVKEKEYKKEGKFPVIDQGKKLIGGYSDDESLLIDMNPPYIIFGDHTKVKKIINFNFIAGGDGIKVFKAKEMFIPELLYYFMYAIDLPDKGYARHFQYLKKSIIPVPPISEQKKILEKIKEIFSEVDKGIITLNEVKEKLEIYKNSILKSAFIGDLTKEWRANNEVLYTKKELIDNIKNIRIQKYKEQGKKEKQSEELEKELIEKLSSIPSEWLWTKLKNFTLGVEYGTSKKSNKNGKIPVLRMGNIQDYKFDWSDLVYSSDEEEINKFLLRKNDVLFNRTNSPELVGKTAIYKENKEAIFAGYLIRINQIEELINPDYLNYFLNSYTAKIYGNSVKTDGVNQSNINGTKLVEYPIPYCSLDEQKEIVKEIDRRLTIYDKISQNVESALIQAEILKLSVLKKAFYGKLL